MPYTVLSELISVSKEGWLYDLADLQANGQSGIYISWATLTVCGWKWFFNETSKYEKNWTSDLNGLELQILKGTKGLHFV